ITLASEDPPAAPQAAEMAYMLHAVTYGFLFQTLMCRPQTVARPLFREQLGALVHGYLARCR
ncbi:MAG: hypothetical protein ACREX0_05650, partial [Noviherbaspirillum sp.]